jgi:hypothetical protein
MTAGEVSCAAIDLISTFKFDLCSEFETPEDYANDLTQEVFSYRFYLRDSCSEWLIFWKKNSEINISNHIHDELMSWVELIRSYSKLVSTIVWLLILSVTVAIAERYHST